MLDFATRFPADLSAVSNKVDEINEQGNAVHTVKIELNGQHGGWDVFIYFSDEELDDHGLVYTMDTHGGMSTNGMSAEGRS